jgi:hypothetical protein
MCVIYTCRGTRSTRHQARTRRMPYLKSRRAHQSSTQTAGRPDSAAGGASALRCRAHCLNTPGLPRSLPQP